MGDGWSRVATKWKLVAAGWTGWRFFLFWVFPSQQSCMENIVFLFVLFFKGIQKLRFFHPQQRQLNWQHQQIDTGMSIKDLFFMENSENQMEWESLTPWAIIYDGSISVQIPQKVRRNKQQTNSPLCEKGSLPRRPHTTRVWCQFVCWACRCDSSLLSLCPVTALMSWDSP